MLMCTSLRLSEGVLYILMKLDKARPAVLNEIERLVEVLRAWVTTVKSTQVTSRD